MANRNSLRAYIKKYHLLDYMDQITMTDRNRDIVLRYVAGESQAGLARVYGISFNEVHQVVATYRSNVVKLMYQRGQLSMYVIEQMEKEMKKDLEKRLECGNTNISFERYIGHVK